MTARSIQRTSLVFQIRWMDCSVCSPRLLCSVRGANRAMSDASHVLLAWWLVWILTVPPLGNNLLADRRHWKFQIDREVCGRLTCPCGYIGVIVSKFIVNSDIIVYKLRSKNIFSGINMSESNNEPESTISFSILPWNVFYEYDSTQIERRSVARLRMDGLPSSNGCGREAW